MVQIKGIEIDDLPPPLRAGSDTQGVGDRYGALLVGHNGDQTTELAEVEKLFEHSNVPPAPP